MKRKNEYIMILSHTITPVENDSDALWRNSVSQTGSKVDRDDICVSQIHLPVVEGAKGANSARHECVMV